MNVQSSPEILLQLVLRPAKLIEMILVKRDPPVNAVLI